MKNIIKDEILISLTKLWFYLSVNVGGCEDNVPPGIQFNFYSYIFMFVMTKDSPLLFKRNFRVCTATFACLQKKEILKKNFLGHCMS